MPFGHAVVTLVSYHDAVVPGELGTCAQEESLINAPGCRHRPLTFQETAELQYDVATELWKTTIPIGEYSAALRDRIVAIQPKDVIRVNGNQYSIIGGVEPFDDFTGPFKATIYSKKHIG
jgi:hypothetical protein